MTREDEIAAKAVRASTLKSLKIKKKLRIRQIEREAEEKIREVNIQYAEDPERLRAKYAADDYAKNERAKKRAARAIEREKKHIKSIKNRRKYTLGEEIFSSIVQGIGAALFIAATALLDTLALTRVSAEQKFIYTILYTCFGSFMIVNYIMSLLHHALTNDTAKEVFRRLSRICVFLVILSAYACYAHAYVVDSGYSLYTLIISGILVVLVVTGILMYAIAGSRLELVNMIFYAVLGSLTLFILNQLYQALSIQSFRMLIVAGITYILGLVFCTIRKIKYFHAVADLILLGASVHLFFSLFFMF